MGLFIGNRKQLSNNLGDGRKSDPERLQDESTKWYHDHHQPTDNAKVFIRFFSTNKELQDNEGRKDSDCGCEGFGSYGLGHNLQVTLFLMHNNSTKQNSMSKDNEQTQEVTLKVKDLGLQICVIDNGFVYVGQAQRVDDFLRIDNAKNIRVWGTDKGLGQLVRGPTDKTVLDPAGTVLVPWGRVVLFLATVSGWEAKHFEQ
jgi:hypothetical protein